MKCRQMECVFCILDAYDKYIWLGFNGLAININNPATIKEHVLYSFFMQDWKGYLWILELVYKVRPISHFFKYKVLVLDVV